RPDIKRADIKTIISRYDCLVLRSKITVDEDLLSLAPNLKVIARGGSGMDNINEPACVKRGITLINVPEANANAVAEHAVGLLLSIVRNMNKSYAEIKERKWLREENRGRELNTLTIGVIGYGHTGSAFAKKMAA